MKWLLVQILTTSALAVLLAGAATAAELGGDLLNGHDAGLAQLSLAGMTNAITGSPIAIDASSFNGVASSAITTGSIADVSMETTGGINVMMINTGALSNQQSVISTSTTIQGLAEIHSLIAGATPAN